ncbi:MAG: alpha/beta hydrolase [Gammaproteobacteria bacterium]|nr:alpha/beta hydrolase [Gammaproteobacteria bacterium]
MPCRGAPPLALVALALLLLLAALLAGCAPARHYEAVQVLRDIAAGEGGSRLKRTTPTPLRQAVTYTVDGRERQADLYLPAALDACADNCPRAALIAVPGAVPLASDDPRFTAFAASFARAGFAVLAPRMPGFRQLRVRPADAREIADAFAYAASRPELAPEGRAGLFAFSYAAGPAVLAALEPDIRAEVRFLVALGGYHDLPRTMRYFTTGWFQQDGRWRHLQPDDTGRMVLAYASLDYLPAGRDGELFDAMVALRGRDPAADLTRFAAQLSPAGQSVYALAMNTDPARFPELLAALPKAMRDDLERLDLSRRDLAPLKARLLLVHGRNDNLIPWPESLSLAAAAPQGQARVFLIHRVLGHVDLSISDLLSWRFWTQDLPDLWRLWRVIDLLLAERTG